MASESPLMSNAETSAYIKKSEYFCRTVLRHEIPHVQRGDNGPIFFFKTDVDRWLAEQTKPAVVGTRAHAPVRRRVRGR